MAKVQKLDRGLNSQLDEFDKRLFLLKISYDKYFSGVEPVEPIRERDEMRRLLREILAMPVQNTRQAFRMQQLRARVATQELFWTRNLLQVERGTHPKQRFRAALREKARAEATAAATAGVPSTAPTLGAVNTAPRPGAADREDASFRAVFDAYVSSREACGQSTDLDYGVVRDTLRKQVETLKAKTQCTSVKFKVVVEEGKAKVKAVPVRAA